MGTTTRLERLITDEAGDCRAADGDDRLVDLRGFADRVETDDALAATREVAR